MASNGWIAGAALGMAISTGGCANSPAVEMPSDGPANVRPPAGEVPYFAAIFYGGANYVCSVSAENSSTYQWVLRSSDENLTDSSWTAYHGRVLPGPVFEARDKSTASGAVVAEGEQNDLNGRRWQWQLLQVVATSGTGPMSKTTSIQRAGQCEYPQAACSPMLSGQETRTNCGGRYRFFRAAR